MNPQFNYYDTAPEYNEGRSYEGCKGCLYVLAGIWIIIITLLFIMNKQKLIDFLKAYKSWYDNEYHDYLTDSDLEFIDTFLQSQPESKQSAEEILNNIWHRHIKIKNLIDWYELAIEAMQEYAQQGIE